MVPIHKRIKAVRKKIGLSQNELADKVKFLNQSQISKIETGGRTVSANDLISISKALNVPIGELVEEEKR